MTLLREDHPTLTAPTASSDSISTVVSSCSGPAGWVRHVAIFPAVRVRRTTISHHAIS
jgi:hypothetical protein